jgi:hypothetical protein
MCIGVNRGEVAPSVLKAFRIGEEIEIYQILI